MPACSPLREYRWMAHQQEDLSQLPPLYERVTTATETPDELQHRLHLEKAKFYASALGVFSIFVVLVLIIFFHVEINYANQIHSICNE